jgi:hypothetical protein
MTPMSTQWSPYSGVMHALSLTLALLLGSACADEHASVSVTEYAQRIEVAQLDSSLPSRTLNEWLHDGPARGVEVRWRQTECDLKHVGDEPATGWPLCAAFMFEQGGVSVRASIVVGTIHEGIKGQPKLDMASISTEELARNGRGDVADRLSEIPQLITKYRKPR